MRKYWIASVAAMAAFAAATLLGPPPPPAKGAPTSPAALALAPIAPIVRAWRWTRVQAAFETGRPEEALEELRMVEALDPSDVNAALFRAHVFGRDFAATAQDAAERFERIAEALDLLARTEARTGDPAAAFARGQFLLEGWTGVRDLRTRFERRYGTTTMKAALDDLRRAVAGAPGSVAARILFAEAARLAAVETLVQGGGWPAARELWKSGVDTLRQEELSTPAGALAVAWMELGTALSSPWTPTASERVAGALRDIDEAATLGGVGEQEYWLAASILPRIIELGQIRLVEEGPRSALFVLEAADTIRRFVDAGTTDSGRDSARETLSRAAVVRLLEGVKSADASLAGDADRVLAGLLRPFDR